MTKLLEFAALRYCTYRLQGSDQEYSFLSAVDDTRSQYSILLKNQVDIIEVNLNDQAKLNCPEAFPRNPRVIRERQMPQLPAYRREVGPCTPTVSEAWQASMGRPVRLEIPGCQVLFNSSIF